MKLKLFLILSVVTGLELIARGPRVLSDKERAALKEQRERDMSDCRRQANIPNYGYSGAKFDECMASKNYSF